MGSTRLVKTEKVTDEDFGPSVQTYKAKKSQSAGNVGANNVNNA